MESRWSVSHTLRQNTERKILVCSFAWYGLPYKYLESRTWDQRSGTTPQSSVLEFHYTLCLPRHQSLDSCYRSGVPYGGHVSRYPLRPPSRSAVLPTRKRTRRRSPSSSKSPPSLFLRPTQLGFAKKVPDIQVPRYPMRK